MTSDAVGQSMLHTQRKVNKALHVLLSFVKRKKYYVLENVDFYFFSQS